MSDQAVSNNSCWPILRWSSQTCQGVWSPGQCQWPACTCDRQGNAGTSCWQCPQGEGQCFSSPHPLAALHSPLAAWCSGRCIWLRDKKKKRGEWKEALHFTPGLSKVDQALLYMSIEFTLPEGPASCVNWWFFPLHFIYLFHTERRFT